MKKLFALIGFTSCFVFQAMTQDYIDYKNLSDEVFRLGLSSFETKNYKEIQGSPYMNPELTDGKVITIDDKVLAGKLRYNIYTDEIEFLYKGSLLSFAKPDNFKAFIIDNQKLIYTSYLEGKKNKKTFMLIVVEGEYSLMIKKNVVFLGKEKPQSYSIPKPDRFETKEDTYYLSLKNQSAKKFSSLKRLIKLFPDLEMKLKNYPGKNDAFDNSDSLKKLVEYLNVE